MKNVLVIENDPSAREGIAKLLIEKGHNVFHAKNEKECITHAKKHQPDLIISDTLIQDMDGYTVVGELWSPFQIFFRKN